jgi:hypothetical protein
VFTSVEATSMQVVEPGAGQQARHRHAGEHAAGGERFHHPAAGAGHANRELVEEAPLSTLTPGTPDQPVGELRRRSRG